MVRNPPFPPSEMQNQPPYATYPPSSESRPSQGAEYYGGPNQPGTYGGPPPPGQAYGGPQQPGQGYGYGGPPAPYGGYPPTPAYGGGAAPPRTESAPAQMTSGPERGEAPRPGEGGQGEGGGGGEDGERGLMGALAGGAAGAFAGHKMHHGILGAVGGAYAGHKLEDAWKHHSQDKKAQHEQQAHQQQQQQQQQKHQYEQQQQQWGHPPYGGPPPPYGAPPGYGGGGYDSRGYGAGGPPAPAPHEMRGNFSGSSEGTSLRNHGGHHWDLVSHCRRVDGSMAESHLPLNSVLGNNDGHFAWCDDGNGNFGASARNVRLVDGGRVLEAELRRVDGSWNWSRVHLDERIGNSDGRLVLA